MNTTQETEFDYQKHMKEGTRGPNEVNRGTEARDKRRAAAKARISQNGQLSRVLEKVQEIAEKSADSDYIYRGEPKHYEKVSSSLYREHSDIDAEHFDIEIIQNEIIEASKRHTSETDDFEILTELQHYGGATNLIDFTSDFHIALFFACDGSDFLDKDGRILLLQENEQTKKQIISPQNPRNRVIAQKSIFVRPLDGFIKPDSYYVINIPKDLKKPLLSHLSKYHGISTETIYNDLHGFIKNQSMHHKAYRSFTKGLISQKGKDYKNAIKYYTEAIKLNPKLVRAYFNRGFVYSERDEFCHAIADYSEAIKCNPQLVFAYYSRMVCRLYLQKWQEAKSDLTTTRDMGMDITVLFRNACINVEEFEKKNGIKLPKDIAAMLTP